MFCILKIEKKYVLFVIIIIFLLVEEGWDLRNWTRKEEFESKTTTSKDTNICCLLFWMRKKWRAFLILRELSFPFLFNFKRSSSNSFQIELLSKENLFQLNFNSYVNTNSKVEILEIRDFRFKSPCPLPIS